MGAFWVAVGSVLYGAVVVFGKVATDRGVAVPTMLGIRFAIAAGLLAAVLAVRGEPLRPARGEGWRIAGLGAAGYAIEAALFFLAVERGTATAVTLLFFTYPVIVTLLAVALGRGAPGWLIGGALAATVAGTVLVVLSSGEVDVTTAGIAFALGSAGVYSLYLLTIEGVLVRTSSLAGAMVVAASASAVLGGYAAAAGSGWPDGWRGWGPLAGMGACTAGAFLAVLSGLRRIGAVRTAIVAALEPLATGVLAALFLDEPLRAGLVTGGTLILSGAVAASLARREPEPGVP